MKHLRKGREEIKQTIQQVVKIKRHRRRFSIILGTRENSRGY